MADYKTLKLNANDPPVEAVLAFDTPKTFENKPPRTGVSYKYTLRLLGPAGGYAAGDEVGFFVEDLRVVEQFNAFRKGDHVVIHRIKNPEMTSPITLVKAGGTGNWTTEATGSQSSTQPGQTGQTEGVAPVGVKRVTMAEALVQAYEAVVLAATDIAERYGTERADEFTNAMLNGEHLRTMANTIFMRG